MADVSAVRERIVGLFLANLHLDIPSAEVDLFEMGVLDSFAFVELLLLLEREFGVGVSVDDLEIDNFRSIDRIAAFVVTHNGGQPKAGGESGGRP
jgi:D-alanine--poly(phosphoribitol) ligase subunit 2